MSEFRKEVDKVQGMPVIKVLKRKGKNNGEGEGIRDITGEIKQKSFA